jgi:formylmethanofuran dehydrogenase subunit C
MRLLLIILTLLSIGAVASATAQTLTVNGADVHVREGAQLTINGNVEHRDGELRVYDDARVDINGNARLVRGSWHLLDDAYMIIRGDLVLELDAVCWRYRPGSLDVEGGITSRGELTNEGEISIGRP